MRKIEQIIQEHIDLPNRKLLYVITNKDLVAALWSSLEHYGIPFNLSNHNILVECVQAKLEGSPDIEREWSEKEYDSFVMFSK